MPPYNIQKRDSLKLQNIPDMEGDLRNNLSRQELIRHPDDGSDPNVVVVPRRDSSEDGERPPENPRLTRKQKTTVAILCFVNLINYMDRFTVAGEKPFILRMSWDFCVYLFYLLHIIYFHTLPTYIPTVLNGLYI